MEKEYKGSNGILVLKDSSIVIKRGTMGFLTSGFVRGDKSIPYSAITAVQFKKAGLLAGYIQLTLMGGSEGKGGLWQATSDENTINFTSHGKNNDLFIEAKEVIEKRMNESRNGGGQKSEADDLEKYAALRDKNVISESEFQAKKKQILGL